MRASNELSPPLLTWMILVCIPYGFALMQRGTSSMQEASLCLSHANAMPKTEAYGALCTSLAALYQQQRDAASNVMGLQHENAQALAAHMAMEKRATDLEQNKTALERRSQELEKHVEKLQLQLRQKDSQARAVDGFKKTVAKRDAEWHTIVHRLTAEKTALLQRGVSLHVSNAADGRRAALLSRQDETSGLMEQIKALQKENAHLVQQCA